MRTTLQDKPETPPLGKMPQDEERRLIRRYQRDGDREAATLLIAQHERALHYIAGTITSRSETEEDLFQQGCIFFLHSVQKYDLRHKNRVRLTTWCYFHVRRQLQRHAMKVGIIRLPPLAFTTDREAAERAAKHITGGLHEDQQELGRDCDGQSVIDDAEERALFDDALRYLDSRCREVIEWRMLGWKLRDIGDMMGITRERVRQIEADGIDKLRAHCNREPVLLK